MVKSVLLGEQAIARFLSIHLLGTSAYKTDRTDVWGNMSRLGWGKHSVATFSAIYYITSILSRITVTKTRVWIGNCIYWILIGRNYK
jgi:hypothetical protein